MLRGQKLIDDVDSCMPGFGELALWWLGQHSFIIKIQKRVIYLDPFLTHLQGRQVPTLLSPPDITNADLILGTHDHADHIDRPAWPALARASPQARFVVPALICEQLSADLSIPFNRFIGLDDKTSASHAGLKISAVAAAHEFLDQDTATGRYPYLGYIVEGAGISLYHAGDSCIYEGLQTRLKRWKFDLMMLPINGRDAVRYAVNCIGNMTYQEAADLAGSLQPRLTIPAHYDMFALNPGDPGAFADYMRVKYPGLRVMICTHGERVIIPAEKN